MARSVYPLLWFKFPVAGVEWSVYFTNERATPAIRGLEGLTLSNDLACYVHRRFMKNERAAQTIALHEMDHAIAWGCGASITLYGNDDDTEERNIQTMTPPRFDTLIRAGMLRFQPIPSVSR